MFDIIAAIDDNNGIGMNGYLPWGKINEDLQFFKETTIDSVVIMGANTFRSISKPLKDRINIVISSKPQSIEDPTVIIKDNLNSALESAKLFGKKIYIIGGAKLYKSAVLHPECNKLIISHIKGVWECDTYFPYDLRSSWLVSCNSFIISEKVSVHEYSNKLPVAWSPEHAYLSLLRDVIDNGYEKSDRTGVSTKSMFGKTVEFNMENGFPLLTTKKMAWRAIVEELLWFLRGSVDVSELSNKGVKIWDANAEDFHMKFSQADNHDPNDLGPVYGHQWRNFDGSHIKCNNCKSDVVIEGVDQISNLIKNIKSNPDSRRLVVSAWNPRQIPHMALPPCHMLFQCYVNTTNQSLSLMMTQRSADIGLGLPFNIASYALLLHILAHITGLKPHKLIISIGDAHVYKNHITPLKQQLNNNLLKLPNIKMNFDKDKKFYKLDINDFEIVDYVSHDRIKMKMAV